MNTIEIAKRAWQTLWRYRALWVWGMVLALTTSSWSAWMLMDREDWQEVEGRGITVTRLGNETFGQALRRTLRSEIDEVNRELSLLLTEVLRVKVRVNVVVLLVVVVAVLLLLHVVECIARYVSEVALIREVDRYQASGERRSVWQGLRSGWSRSAWRLFFINLTVDVVGIVAAILLFGLLFALLPLWVNAGEAVIFLFSFLTAGLFFVALVAVILWGVALSVLKRLAWRACALDGLRVFPSIRQGYAVLVHHFKETGGTWLVTAAVRWGWRAAMVPVVLTLIGLGLLSGSLPGLLVGGATGLFSSGELPVFLALAVGIPLFLLVLVAPLILLAGLREVFLSTTWTLTYRELRAVESPAAQSSPAADVSGLESAPALS
jgi:hypothetical protein